MKKFYAGIGSRETPQSVYDLIIEISIALIFEGYTLRSGGAPGADTMFEERVPTENKEIYLPWRLFHSNTSPLYTVDDRHVSFSLKYHPRGSSLPPPVRLLMGRNAYQVLGRDLQTHSDFVVCWTPNGVNDHSPVHELYEAGGTGQALRIAKAHNIPIFNLGAPGCDNFEAFKVWYCKNCFDIL